MLLKEILDIYNLLDSAHADGNSIKTHLLRIRSDANVEVVPIVTPKGSTDIIRILVKGKNGRSQNGTAPTIGLWAGLEGSELVQMLWAMYPTAMVPWLLFPWQQSFWICRIKATSWKAMFIWLPYLSCSSHQASRSCSSHGFRAIP